MEKNLIPLNKVPMGTVVRVKELELKGIKRRRMLDLGLVENTKVEALRKSPSGDPTAYEIRGTVIALRIEEAANIFVEVI